MHNRFYLLMFFLYISKLLCSQTDTTCAEDKPYQLYVRPIFNYGFVAAHKPNMQYFVNDHFSSIEFDIGINTLGNKNWHHYYSFPDYGVGFFYTGLKNDQYLGKAYAIMPFMNFPLFGSRHSKLREFFKLGAGVGYLTKKNNRFNNYKNFIIGSHFNAAISLFFESRYLMNERLSLSTAFGLTHFSNGATKKPNLGINIASANTSLYYHFLQKKNYASSPLNKQTQKKEKLEYMAIVGMGNKEIDGSKQKYNVYFLETGISKSLSQKSSLTGGIHLFYDNSDFTLLEKDSIEYGNSVEIVKPGIFLGHDLKIENFSVIFITGSYIYAKEKTDEMIYSKLALRYTINDHFIVDLSLKSHYAVAEFIGYGIGYKF